MDATSVMSGLSLNKKHKQESQLALHRAVLSLSE